MVVGVEQPVTGATDTTKLSWQVRRYTSAGVLDPDPAANPGFCVSRLNADGTLDKTFGTQGKTVVKPGVNVTLGNFFVDATGAVTVVGATTTAVTFRLTPSGTLDMQFGMAGIIESNAVARATAAVGDCLLRTLVAAPGPASGAFSTARYLRNGLIDPVFAATSNGFAQTNAGIAPSPVQLLLRPNGRIVALTVDRAAGTLTIAQFLGDAACARAGSAVVEFYNTNLNTYFITADSNEASAIDKGAAGPGWMRTGLTFKSGGSDFVCRFYGSPSPGPDSHFYTLSGSECSGLLQIQAVIPSTQKRWNFESLDFASTSRVVVSAVRARRLALQNHQYGNGCGPHFFHALRGSSERPRGTRLWHE